MVLNGEIVKMDGISYNEVDDFVNEIISISSGMDEINFFAVNRFTTIHFCYFLM